MANSKEEVKTEACINIPDPVQRFAVLNCEVASTENVCNYSSDLVNLPNNLIAPKQTDLGLPYTTCQTNNNCMPTIIDLTVKRHNSQEIVVDRPRPTLVGSDIKNDDSDNVSKTSECKKHKIPEMQTTAVDCSPCKVPKVTPTLVCASFAKISSSNSTITSGSQTLVNGNTSNSDYLPRHTMQIKREEHIDLKPIHYQILDMFPNIEYNYLINLCSQESDINQIINILLETGDYPRESNKEPSNECQTPYLYRPYNDDEVIVQYESNPRENHKDTLNGGLTPYLCTPYNNSEVNVQYESNPREIHKEASTEGSEVNLQHLSNLLNDSPIDLGLFQDCKQDQLLKESVVSENNRLEFLISIFPDADRTFLETKSKLDDNKLEEFINEVSESRNYPKLVVKVDKKPESNDDEELGLYTTAFNIDNFLKIFPEPVKYFMDENRKCRSSLHDLEFLKRRYQFKSMKEITQKYKDLGYNLSRTCEALDKTPATRCTKRSANEIRMPPQQNLVFLQEACFVEHKTEIVSYINSKAEKKQLEYDLAKEKGELIECGCCYDQCIFEDCAACNEGDLFCKQCIKKSAEVRIGDGLNNFPCLLACGAEFSLQLLQNLLDANIFSRLIKRIQLEEVRAADIEGLEVCPFCEFATIPPPETNIFTCLNPECLKESCRKCHKVSHIPQRCEEIENDDQARARKYIEDEMTKALVRECYKCKKSFIKMEGCNKMTCTCGAKMCYICRQPITDYKHFNGPGADDKSKCPLYSTDKVLHVDAVTAVAKQALEEINTMNPSLQLKHDPTKVLPAAAKTTLPPGVHENPLVLIQRLNQRNVQRPTVVRPNHNQARNNLDAIIDNVARGVHHNLQHHNPADQPRAFRPHMPVQHAHMAYRPPIPYIYQNERQNNFPGTVDINNPLNLANHERADTIQALRTFDDIMELVRRRHERDLPQ